MKKRPTLHTSGVHRLPEGPTAWHLDDATRRRALAGIAKARAALAAAVGVHEPTPPTLDLHHQADAA